MIKPPPKTYSVEIPTKTYLRKYVYAKYGEPFRLLYKHNFSTLILCLLDKNDFTIDMRKYPMDVRMSQMNDNFICYAPITTMSQKGFSLDNDKIIAINRFLEKEFYEELSKYCRDNIKDREFKPGFLVAIKTFAEQFGIVPDVDITLDALRKAEYRYRKSRETFFRNFVPKKNLGELVAAF